MGKKRRFYEREYDSAWLERQYGRRRERAKIVHRSAAGWLCPVPVSDSRFPRLPTRVLERNTNVCSMKRLMNKLRPGSISRIDPREDGKLRTSNVTKFLASCSANGLPPEDLFLRDDLIEGTSDCLARVAQTIITLVKWAETPVPTQSHILRGGKGGSKLKPINITLANAASPGSPYRTGSSSSRAIMSSPNLSVPPPISHPPLHTSTSKHHLPPGLPTLRSHSPDTASSSDAFGTETEGRQTPTGTNSDRDEVPPIVAPPPRSPLRSLLNESARMSIADSTTGQSIASSNMTDTSTYSSLLDGGRIGSASGPYYGNGKFGTIRTVTTEATSFIPSEWPSMTRTEGSAMAASMLGCDDGPGDIAASIYGNNSPNGHVGGRRRSLEGPTVRPRERKPSETVPVDLLRVVEESEELAGASDDRTGRMERINLGKGKWPDDFLDALKASSAAASSSRPIAIRKRSGDLGISASTSVNSSAGAASFPPRGSVDSLSLSSSFPSTGITHPLAAAAAAAAARRPTHRARHSVDAPVVLAPKDVCTVLRRDSSPDPSSLGLGSSPSRVALRRNSTRNGRSGTYVPRRSSPEDGGSGGDNSDSQQQQQLAVPIPFPRAVSGESPSPFSTPSQSQSSPQFEHAGAAAAAGGGSISATSSADASASSPSLIPRGRFQSEVDGSSSRRRPRPNSYDEFGAKPRRSRFESMVNLGVASGEQASASDLMARDATEGSVSRQTLVVREEGKAPTHFVSGPAICVGDLAFNQRILLSNWAIVLGEDSLALCIARST